MKNHLIISLLFLFVGCSTVQKEYDINNLYETDGLYIEKFSEDNVTGIIYRMYGKKKVTIGQMKDGIKEGEWIDWYENGQKSFEKTYKYGKIDGLTIGWYQNGQKKEEGSFKDGKKDGLDTFWFENGQKKWSGYYTDGKKDGLWISWYKNGQKDSEGYFKDGKEIDKMCWDEDGNECECSENWRGGCE